MTTTEDYVKELKEIQKNLDNLYDQMLNDIDFRMSIEVMNEFSGARHSIKDAIKVLEVE